MHCPSSIWLSLPAFVRGPGHPKPSSRSNIVAGSGAPSTHSRRIEMAWPHKRPSHTPPPSSGLGHRTTQGWMLRLLHLPTAFETRGYPAHINGVLRMSIHDSIIPENSGHWELTVQSGKGVLTRGGAGGLETNMSTLSTLYSGFYTAQSLQDAGQLRGSESDIALANQLFNGPEPYCPDAF